MHVYCHSKWVGFTAGTIAVFLDINGNAIFNTGLIQHGVDGEWVGTSDTTYTDVFHVTTDVAARTNTIHLIVGWFGKNRLWSDLGAAISWLGQNWDWIWNELSTVWSSDSSGGSGDDTGDSNYPPVDTEVSCLVAGLLLPTAVSPVDGAAISNLAAETTVSWQPVPGADYYVLELQFTSNPHPSTLDSDWPQKETYNHLTTTTRAFNWGRWAWGRWRVTACDSSGAHFPSVPSPWRTFQYVTPPMLSMPVPISPSPATQFTNTPRTTTLTWQPVPNATSYFVEVMSCSIGPSGPSWQNVVMQTVQTNSYTFTFPDAKLAQWSVTAGDDTGKYSPSAPSPWQPFDYRTPLSTPILDSPTDRTIFTSHPRTTSLKWHSPTPGVTEYLLEWEYGDQASLSSPTTPTWSMPIRVELRAASCTFDFPGDQVGRWRVTALDETGAYRQSAPTSWFTFEYTATTPSNQLRDALRLQDPVNRFGPIGGLSARLLKLPTAPAEVTRPTHAPQPLRPIVAPVVVPPVVVPRQVIPPVGPKN